MLRTYTSCLCQRLLRGVSGILLGMVAIGVYRLPSLTAQMPSSAPLFPSAVFDTTYSGVWTGLVDPAQRAVVRRVVVRITKTIRGNCDAIVNLPNQRVMNAQANYAACTGDAVAFAVPMEDISYSGRLDSSTMTINGTWNQNGLAYPLLLRKLESLIPAPPPTLNGTALPLRIHNYAAMVELDGELVVPHTKRRWPVIVLVYDDGPQDRDGKAWNQRPLFDLANELARQGWASFRMDDRGVGGSTGADTSATIDDLAGDVVAAVATLAKHPNIDTNRILVLGLGEGGIVAAAAAAKSALVSGVVTLSAPTLDGITLLKEQIDLDQRSRGRTPSVITAYKQTVAAWYNTVASQAPEDQMVSAIIDAASELLVNNPESAEINAMKGFLSENPEQYVRLAILPWLRTFYGISPGPYFRAGSTPVLALFAGDDPVVPAEPNAAAMKQWLENRAFSAVEIVPGHNHRFQRCHACTLEEMEFLPESIDIGIANKVLSWASSLPVKKKPTKAKTRP